MYTEQLEPGDHWRNRRKGVTLPHDGLLKKPDELAAMSGPVITYFIGGGAASGQNRSDNRKA